MSGFERGELIATGRTAEVFAWGEGRVLKLIRPDMPNGLADVEVRAAAVVEAAGLAAPKLLETVRLDGRIGLVYERVDGPSMLQVMLEDPASVPRLAAAFASLHVAMHESSGAGLPETRAGMRRAIDYSRDSGVLPPAIAGRVLELLDRRPDGGAVIHGDLHPGNVIMAASGPEVIDWMSVSQGDPLADVARTAFLIRESNIGDMPEAVRAGIQAVRGAFVDAYLSEYERLRPFDRAAVAAWRPVVLAARLAEGIERERAWLVDELRIALGG